MESYIYNTKWNWQLFLVDTLITFRIDRMIMMIVSNCQTHHFPWQEWRSTPVFLGWGWGRVDNLISVRPTWRIHLTHRALRPQWRRHLCTGVCIYIHRCIHTKPFYPGGYPSEMCGGKLHLRECLSTLLRNNVLACLSIHEWLMNNEVN